MGPKFFGLNPQRLHLLLGVTRAGGNAALNCTSSAALSVSAVAARFSSRYFRRLVSVVT